MGFAYEDLYDHQFEDLVVQFARKLFGIGVESFAQGPDGGRDARFEGRAERFPSTVDPWMGVTVVQAKHTIGTNAHFSDNDFSGPTKSSVLTKEIIRIKKLVVAGEIKNYILFSNRRLGGVTASAIKQRIADETGLDPSLIFLAGVEYMDRLIGEYPDVLGLAAINPVDGPLLVSSYEIAEVILAIATELAAPLPLTDAPVVDRVSYDDKNRLNRMSDEFADLLSDRYMQHARRITEFLSDPGNQEVLRYYEAAVEDFQLKIVARQTEFQRFDDLFNYLVDLLTKRDGVLSRHRTVLRVMLFYMYWHCDIGKSVDAGS